MHEAHQTSVPHCLTKLVELPTGKQPFAHPEIIEGPFHSVVTLTGRGWLIRKIQTRIVFILLETVLATLQAYTYLGDDKQAARAIQEARSSDPADAAIDKLEKLLQERLKLNK